MMMDEKVEDSLSEKIKEFLPVAIQRVIGSYDEFAAQEMPEEAKAFSNYHVACKAALTHLEALFKIMKNMPFNDVSKDNEMSNISLLIQQAKKSIQETEINSR